MKGAFILSTGTMLGRSGKGNEMFISLAKKQHGEDDELLTEFERYFCKLFVSGMNLLIK